MAADILDSLKSLIADQPGKAVQVIEDLRVQWTSMTDEQRAEAKSLLGSLQGRLAGLTEEQRKAVMDKIAGLV